jgi:hypothetical protein
MTAVPLQGGAERVPDVDRAQHRAGAQAGQRLSHGVVGDRRVDGRLASESFLILAAAAAAFALGFDLPEIGRGLEPSAAFP